MLVSLPSTYCLVMDKIQTILAPVMFSINDVSGVPFWIFYDRHEVKILVENLMANSESILWQMAKRLKQVANAEGIQVNEVYSLSTTCTSFYQYMLKKMLIVIFGTVLLSSKATIPDKMLFSLVHICVLLYFGLILLVC